MHFKISAYPLAVLSWLCVTHLASAATHGEGDEGTTMGPVAFLWPDDRKWDAADDNIGPCGSSEGATNRTIFPLSQGSVALSIADDAWEVAFYIAFDNNPTSQSQFEEQVVHNVTEIEPGHQCYKIDALPSTVAAGSNATIQLQYWAKYGDENGGKNESFYACADVTFVQNTDFTLQVPCFNVTADDFGGGVATTTTTVASTTPTPNTTGAASSSSSSPAAPPSSSSSSGLSGGAKAGVAVGTIVGSIAVGLGVAFFLLRRRRQRAVYPSHFGAPIPLAKRSGADAISVNTN